MKNKDLESKLVVGAKVKIGREYAENSFLPLQEGNVIILEEGRFYYDNGLYEVEQRTPAIWDDEIQEWYSIYHLFENDLSGFLDCEVINES